MMHRIILITALLTLAACDSQQKTTALDANKANWDVIAAADGTARVKNGFLIMMR